MTRRRNALDINFDSLTDTITNLCGGMILLVMLVTFASQPKIAGVKDLPPPENKIGAKSRVDVLLDNIQTLNIATLKVEQQTAEIEARLPELEEEIDQLDRKLQGDNP